MTSQWPDRPDTLRGRLATRVSEGGAGLQAWLLYLIGALIVTWDAWAAPTTRWIGGCCDPEQTIWFVRWVPYAIGHGVDPLITHQLNAPDGVNLMWNTSILPWSLIATPITLLAGPILAYNLLMLGAIVASALVARLASRATSRARWLRWSAARSTGSRRTSSRTPRCISTSRWPGCRRSCSSSSTTCWCGARTPPRRLGIVLGCSASCNS